jgi:hypothetical protein
MATARRKLTDQNLGRVNNSRSGSLCVVHYCSCEPKLPNLKLKTFKLFPLDIALSAMAFITNNRLGSKIVTYLLITIKLS